MIIEANQASISRVIYVTVMESGHHENLLWNFGKVLLQNWYVKFVIVKTFWFHFVCMAFFVRNWRNYCRWRYSFLSHLGEWLAPLREIFSKQQNSQKSYHGIEKSKPFLKRCAENTGLNSDRKPWFRFRKISDFKQYKSIVILEQNFKEVVASKE